jgi:hypothetical protein
VNSIRLEAHVPKELNNGDLIRLGHFLMFIYFSGEQTQLKTSISLVETGQSSDLLSHQGATMNYITKKILPCLTAVIEIQRVINDLMERVGSEVYIKTVDIYQKGSHIEIQIDGATEAIGFIVEQVNPWKKRYAQVYYQQTVAEKAPTSSDSSPQAASAAPSSSPDNPPQVVNITPSSPDSSSQVTSVSLSGSGTPPQTSGAALSGSGTLPQTTSVAPPKPDAPTSDKPLKLSTAEFRTSYLELAQNLVKQYAPSLASELQGNYVERVLLQLRALIESSLEVTAD